MMATGSWWDKRYASCCFMGARAKSQCLRHNLPEINDWPVLDCHHTHDPREWEPSVENGKRIYPSHEEAEYTAPLAFAIAVAASWWAVRMGRATLHVPRMPAISWHGRREHWLAINPKAMREWAMAPLAISLGLEPPDALEAQRVPKRGHGGGLHLGGQVDSTRMHLCRSRPSFPPPSDLQVEHPYDTWTWRLAGGMGGAICGPYLFVRRAMGSPTWLAREDPPLWLPMAGPMRSRFVGRACLWGDCSTTFSSGTTPTAGITARPCPTVGCSYSSGQSCHSFFQPYAPPAVPTRIYRVGIQETLPGIMVPIAQVPNVGGSY